MEDHTGAYFITDWEIVDTPEGVGLSVAYAMRKDRK